MGTYRFVTPKTREGEEESFTGLRTVQSPSLSEAQQGRHPPSWSSEQLERTFQIWKHALNPAVGLNYLTIGVHVLLQEDVARVVI